MTHANDRLRNAVPSTPTWPPTASIPPNPPPELPIEPAIAHQHPFPLTTPDAQAAHRRLQRFHLIETAPGQADRIEIPLLQRWIRDRAPEA